VTGLARRDTAVVELMDDPGCDLHLLRRTYRQFAVVNRLVSGWRHLYTRTLRPLLAERSRSTLLDVGFGGGDIPLCLSRWARHDGLDVAVTAVDPDPRAADFMGSSSDERVEFRQASTADLVAEGRRFDVVVSNHLLHHLDAAALQALLADSERLATRLALHNDLQRSAFAYGGYGLLTWPLARSSFLHTDGMLSIRRSYRPPELAGVRPGWSVRSAVPFRLHLLHEPGGAA
jgi:2-polyprenyl-3-methyl-5-hydroxy-6-metoxy-1,4-benzoquinol methylase